MKSLATRLWTNRFLLRAIYYPWIVLPYPARRVVTIAGVWGLQLLKRARRIQRRQSITPPEKMFALSFWGIPSVNPTTYVLAVDGSVQHPLTLPLEEIKRLPSVERQVILDCVGGSRNIGEMRGVLLERLFEMAHFQAQVRTAVLHCADGYFTSHPVEDLLKTEAFMAYVINGRELPEHGFPLRLVAPGKYGYKWAKWVVRIELVTGSPKGYWEQRGLPDRAWVGDVR